MQQIPAVNGKAALARMGSPATTPDAEVFWLESALDAPAVIFSSSDGSDPNKNGRKYSILVQKGTGIPSKEKKNRPIAADIDWSRY